MQKVGIFGGTFDPVHNGHLQMAVEAQRSLGLDQVRLVPCHIPPHRSTPNLSGAQRLKLLKLAVEDYSGLIVDDRELRSHQTSYTVDTLLSFRQEFGDKASLVLMVGMDAFAHLTSWNRWQQLRNLAHIAVIARPESSEPEAFVLKQWLTELDSVDIFDRQASGGFMLLKQSLLPISSTQIREKLAAGQRVDDLPLKVTDYIKQHHWYQ